MSEGVKNRREFKDYNLEQLADEMAYGANSFRHHAAVAEFTRREAVWQRDAAEAMKKSARAMWWSVIGIWVTTSLVALFTGLLWYAPQISNAG